MFAVRDYVSTMDKHQSLLDKLCQRSYFTDAQGNSKAPLFPVHLTPEQVHVGIKSGKLVQGTFFASRDNFLEGNVNVDGIEKMVNNFKCFYLLYCISTKIQKFFFSFLSFRLYYIAVTLFLNQYADQYF
jgi:hypothetical protein